MTGRTLTDPRSLRTSSDRWFLTPSLRVVQAFTQVRHGLSKLATRDEASKHAGRVERLEERLKDGFSEGVGFGAGEGLGVRVYRFGGILVC